MKRLMLGFGLLWLWKSQIYGQSILVSKGDFAEEIYHAMRTADPSSMTRSIPPLSCTKADADWYICEIDMDQLPADFSPNSFEGEPAKNILIALCPDSTHSCKVGNLVCFSKSGQYQCWIH